MLWEVLCFEETKVALFGGEEQQHDLILVVVQRNVWNQNGPHDPLSNM